MPREGTGMVGDQHDHRAFVRTTNSRTASDETKSGASRGTSIALIAFVVKHSFFVC